MKKTTIIWIIIIFIFAIFLFFLFTPIICCSIPKEFDTKNAISNSLSIVGKNGSTISPTFNLSDGLIISSQDFAEDGFDQQSIFFGINTKLLDSSVANNFSFVLDNDNEKFSFFYYEGATNFKGRARVACQENGEQLDRTLNELSISYESHSNSAQEYCEDSIPCCIVILERAK